VPRPSAATRWFACPGSEAKCAAYPYTSSHAADQGTFAHLVASECLEKGMEPKQWLGSVSKDAKHTCDQEMVDAVTIYTDAVRSLALLGEIRKDWIEKKVTTPDPVDNGTVDYAAVVDRTLHVMDYKHGAGVYVDHEQNKQAMIYAVALLDEVGDKYAIETVVVHIVQPRHEGAKPWRQEPRDARDLRIWGDMELVPAAKATEAKDAPLNPTEDGCRFCPAAVDCEARRAQAQEVAKFAFDPVPTKPPLPEMLAPEELSKILTLAPIVRQWLKAVEDRAYELGKAGTPPTGYKMVDKIGLRKWKDEDAARVALVDAGIEPFDIPKLLSPAKAEKALGKARAKLVAPLVHKPTTGILLVPESDKRPARNPAAVFDAVDE